MAKRGRPPKRPATEAPASDVEPASVTQTPKPQPAPAAPEPDPVPEPVAAAEQEHAPIGPEDLAMAFFGLVKDDLKPEHEIEDRNGILYLHTHKRGVLKYRKSWADNPPEAPIKGQV